MTFTRLLRLIFPLSVCVVCLVSRLIFAESVMQDFEFRFRTLWNYASESHCSRYLAASLSIYVALALPQFSGTSHGT